MQHSDQHIQAIKPTVRVVNSVSCVIFDDKVKDAGRITVEKGEIRIELHHGFHQTSTGATKDLLLDSIRLGLEQCFDARPEAFDPHQS